MNMKKLTAALLAVIMLMAMIPVVAMAADNTVDASKVVKVGSDYYLVDSMTSLTATATHTNTVYAAKYTGGDAHNNVDFISALVWDGVNYDAKGKDAYQSLRNDNSYWLMDGKVHVCLSGWISPASNKTGGNHNEPITYVGYQHNGDEIVWIAGATKSHSYTFQNDSTAVVEDDALKSTLNGYGWDTAVTPYIRRYNIDIDFSTLGWAQDITHEIYFYAKDNSGNIYCLNNTLTGDSAKPVVMARSSTLASHFDANGNKYTLAADGYTLSGTTWLGYAVSNNATVAFDFSKATKVYADGNGNFVTSLTATNFTYDQVFMVGDTLTGTKGTITALTDLDVVPTPVTTKAVTTHSLDVVIGEASNGSCNNEFKSLVNGGDNLNVGTGGYWANIGFYGWVAGFDAALTDIGYSVNGGETVWYNRSGSTKVPTSLGGTWPGDSSDPHPLWDGEAGVQAAGSNGTRFTFWVPVSDLSKTCVNYVYLYVKDANGTVWNMTNVATGNVNLPIKIYTATKGTEIGDYTDGTNQYLLAADGSTLTTLSGAATGLSVASSLTGTPVAVTTAGMATCTNLVGGFTGASVSLGTDLSVTYTAKFYNVSGTIAPKAVFTKSGKTTTVEGVAGTDNTWSFKFENVAPQTMGDNIKAELYVGDDLMNTKATYSVKENLLNIAANNADNSKLLTLIYNTLNYGAAAQTYVNYNADALVNAGYESKVTNFENTSSNVFSLTVGSAEYGRFTSATVEFDNVNRIVVLIGDMKADNHYSVTINGKDTAIEDGMVKTDGISVTNFDTEYTFILYVNGLQRHELHYSVNTYITRVTTALNTALYNYGAAAAAYMAG